MSSRQVMKFIPKALETLISEGIVKENNKIPKEFSGYISSFGASVIQSGLLPTVEFFERPDSDSKEDRRILMRLILLIIDGSSSEADLLDYIIKNQKAKPNLRERIIDASVAIKLAMRTFEFGE